MSNNSHYEIVKETFSVISFYGETYTSSPEFQVEFKKIIETVRIKAENYKSKPRAKQFLLDFADALEKENNNI